MNYHLLSERNIDRVTLCIPATQLVYIEITLITPKEIVFISGLTMCAPVALQVIIRGPK